eukprot:Phypoly_transcript_06766.p1 GENE.Phypoly_transcript_06766~~Phypoly_transcript_06766.p1  ORF type:complete len:349 (+),score=56.07 Phypoly_transcript_06766:435-1481(+)
MTAVGPVTLAKLNLDFVRNLLSVDHCLSMKFYRMIATKYTALFFQILGNMWHPSLSAPNTIPIPVTRTLSYVDQRIWSKPNNHHDHANVKTYELEPSGHYQGVPFLAIKAKKIKIMSKMFGLHTKTRILFDRIDDVTKIGDKAATIAYRPKKASTVFFKEAADRDEFVSLVKSILPTACITNAPQVNQEEEEETDYSEGAPCGSEEQDLYGSISHEEKYKKGDFLFQEGDIFQRVFTITSGVIDISQNGFVFSYLRAGDIVGVGALFILRPSVVTMQVASDTATAMVMPGHKIFALMETHVSVADKIMRNAAAIQARLCLRSLHQLDARRAQIEAETNEENKKGDQSS